MEAYCAVPPDDPFAVSRDLFSALAAELAGPAAAGLTACQLEDLLDERGREVLRQLLQDHFDLRAAREEQQAREHRAPATGADGITRTRLETEHGRLLATLFGTVRVTRCAWRRPGTSNFCPADAALSLPVVLSADSKGLVMRPGALRAATAKAAARLGKMRTRLTAGEKPNRK